MERDGIPYKMHLPGYTGSEATFRDIRESIARCFKEHARCRERGSAERMFPKRILDIRGGRIVLREDLAPGGGRGHFIRWLTGDAAD